MESGDEWGEVNMIRSSLIRCRSFYIKLVVMFVAIGLLPLLVMGGVIYNTYSSTLYSAMLSNFCRTTNLTAQNLSNLIMEISDATEYIYKNNVTDYDYFYELFEDEKLSETGRNAMVTRVLRTILYMNDAIDHVMFFTPDGGQYFSMRPPELLVDRERLNGWYETSFLPETRAVAILPTHKTDYYVSSDQLDFTIYRNIMHTGTIQQAGREVLGTLFIDVRADYIGKMLVQADYGEEHQIFLADAKSGQYIYRRDGIYGEENMISDGLYLEEMDASGDGYIKRGREYFVYSFVDGTDWIIIDRINASALDKNYKMIRNSTFALMAIGTVLLLAVYLVYSQKLNQPVSELKEAMGRIEKGNLGVRVQIQSNDELEDIGRGLNRMVENLSSYIQKAYIAEIRQRDAELEALKTQIQPHYLYNTLDVIRMSAVTNDDQVVADMINSLSSQLKYLIGRNGNKVKFREEAECIKNYFRLIEIRYDYQFSLLVNIPEGLLDCFIPHLIIQPVVENAVKHGLRPKKGTGHVVVEARENLDFLEISVMDNGVGINETRLAEIKRMLAGSDAGWSENIKEMSIGLKNISGRIRYLYGEEYGLEIESYEGIGTLIKYWLPLQWEDDQPGDDSKQDGLA